MRTFGLILEKNRGVGPGFDFLRLALALSVLAWHSVLLTWGWTFAGPAVDGPLRIFVYFIVPAFFALSGFLVAGSMARLSSLRLFATFRILRIAPALATEITLSALVLGPLVTAMPAFQYFGDSQFWKYFLNILGFPIQFRLPGVFLNNPMVGTVNGSLWTVPNELRCYILLAVLMVTRVATRRWAMLAVFAALAIASGPWRIHSDHATLNSGYMLVLSFLCGSVFYLWKDRIPANLRLASISFLGFSLFAYWLPPGGFIVGVVCVTYVTVYIGMLKIPRIPVLMSGDYSYGIYLYAYPIEQTVVWALPSARHPAALALIAAPLTIAFAMFSWHCIEKPALALRKRMSPKSVVNRFDHNDIAAPAAPYPLESIASAKVAMDASQAR